MIDLDQLVGESLDRLVPQPAVTADWEDVLARAGARSRHVRRRTAAARSARSRLVFVVALLLLLTGAATATYVGVRGWVSAGPRGIQHRDTYRLTRVFATPNRGGSWWRGWALSPSGRDLYVIRPKWFRADQPRRPELVRIEGVDRRAQLREQPVFDLSRLEVRGWCVGPPGFAQPLTVAGNGDVFLVVGTTARPGRLTCEASQVVVLHQDGSFEPIVAADRLGAGIWTIAASANDHVWLHGESLGGGQQLVELVDPNANGNWRDRRIRTVTLPASPPFRRARLRSDFLPQWGWQLIPEPSLPGSDRSDSVLALLRDRWGTASRLYRIADRNDDGDALDAGEVRLVLEHAGSGVSVRVVTMDGVARRELVVAGMGRPDRVSLVPADGRVRDVARAFRGLAGVLTGPDGRLYPITVGGGGSPWVVYRLEPTTERGGVGTSPAGPADVPRVSFPARAANGLPQLAFTVAARGGGFRRYTTDVDGRHVHQLISGDVGTRVCRSTDGRALAFTSDVEVPSEFFTYVGTDGTQPRKVTERADSLVCPFKTPWLLLSHVVTYDPRTGSPVGWLTRHDLRTGKETVVVRGVDSRYALSPDATSLAYVTRGREALVVVDVPTLTRRVLVRAAPDVVYTDGQPGAGGLSWSPDGHRIAYATGRGRRGAIWLADQHAFGHVLWVRDVVSGRVLLRRAIGGGSPAVSWSPEGERLLVCVEENHRASAGCSGGAHAERLVLLDLRRRTVRTVAHGELIYAGWAPSGSSYAYAEPSGIFVVTIGGSRRKVVSLPEGYAPVVFGNRFAWLGWSPDGRYIALDAGRGEKSPSAIQVVDVQTGRLHTLRPRQFEGYYLDIDWWSEARRSTLGAPSGGGG